MLIAAAVPAAMATGSPEQTRESYVARVEPICKTNTRANEGALAGAREEIRKGRLRIAASRFAKASAAFGATVRQIRAVPRPAADETRLTKWLGRLADERRLLGEVGKALKAGRKSKAEALWVRLSHNGNLANNLVLGFGFDYCLIDSARFQLTGAEPPNAADRRSRGRRNARGPAPSPRALRNGAARSRRSGR